MDAANTYAVFVWGPERVKVEYVEHKPTLLADLSRARPARRRRGDGRPVRGRARARARRATPVVLEKGDARRAARCCSRAASSGGYRDVRGLPPRVPGRRRAAPAARVRAGSTRGSTWLVSLGRRGRVGETRANPRTTGKRFDPREPDGRARPGGRRCPFRPRPGACPRDMAGRAAGARDRRLLRPPRARARAARALQPVERGRRARLRPRARGRGVGRPRRVLRPRDARAAGARGGGRLRAPLAALGRRGPRRSARTARSSSQARRPGTRATWRRRSAGSRAGRPGYVTSPASTATTRAWSAAREAGGTVVEEDGELRIHVIAGVTHTLGGIRVDEDARGRRRRRPVRRGRRRGRDLERRLLQRARRCARPRPPRGRNGYRVAAVS